MFNYVFRKSVQDFHLKSLQRISQRLIDHIGGELDDSILANNENFLDKEYKAMIVRLHRMGNDASEKVMKLVEQLTFC